jgi:hypothetical protein
VNKRIVLLGVGAVALGVCLAGCAGRERVRPVRMSEVDIGPGSLEAVRKQLEGKWVLTSLQMADAAGALVAVPASGALTYDAYGNFELDVEITEFTAMPAIGDRPLALDLKGRAVIDAAGGLLQVQDVATAAGTVAPPGLERVRQFQFHGELLTLTARDAAGRRTGVTTWRRQP